METDYLVVGAGAAGMAFADSLVDASPDAEVLLVDRRHRPGGHWNDAYPFVRLHLPSAYYGVNSLPLGNDAVDADGPNAGLYERATGAEVGDYFGRVLDERLLPTGRVRFHGMTDYAGDWAGEHVLRSRLSGETYRVEVRRKVVDATYLEAPVPATHTPSFSVEPGTPFVPVNGLVSVAEPPGRYVVLGGGKTSMDACLWLLDNGVPPDRVRWVRPREAWLLDRAGWQPLDQLPALMEGLADELEALAAATTLRELFEGLESRGRFHRIDRDAVPTMFRCATVSDRELALLRSVTDVVRLGRVLRISPSGMDLDGGSVPGDPGALYVDCSAPGARSREPRPVFDGPLVTIQQVRFCAPTFNSALIGYVEATRDDEAAKNRLCPASPLPCVPEDWLRGMAVTLKAARRWLAEPDLAQWVDRSRLNLLGGLGARAGDPRMQAALGRYGANIAPAMARLPELLPG